MRGIAANVVRFCCDLPQRLIFLLGQTALDGDCRGDPQRLADRGNVGGTECLENARPLGWHPVLCQIDLPEMAVCVDPIEGQFVHGASCSLPISAPRPMTIWVARLP